jgi:hypothetical protein
VSVRAGERATGGRGIVTRRRARRWTITGWRSRLLLAVTRSRLLRPAVRRTLRKARLLWRARLLTVTTRVTTGRVNTRLLAKRGRRTGRGSAGWRWGTVAGRRLTVGRRLAGRRVPRSLAGCRCAETDVAAGGRGRLTVLRAARRLTETLPGRGRIGVRICDQGPAERVDLLLPRPWCRTTGTRVTRARRGRAVRWSGRRAARIGARLTTAERGWCHAEHGAFELRTRQATRRRWWRRRRAPLGRGRWSGGRAPRRAGARRRRRVHHEHRALELGRRSALQIEPAFFAGRRRIGVLSPTVRAKHLIPPGFRA